MSQQNDTELWDLIQDSPADEAEAPGKKSGYQAPAKSGKNPWMFATIGLGAALAVTVGLLLTRPAEPQTPAPPTGSSNNALVQELETQLQSVEAEKEALLEQIRTLNTTVDSMDVQIEELLKLYNEMSENLEYVESNHASSSGEANAAHQRTLEAYRLLIKAQNAFLRYDEDTLNECIDELMDDLDLLDQNALTAFYNVMEYMEQPYWRNQ